MATARSSRQVLYQNAVSDSVVTIMHALEDMVDACMERHTQRMLQHVSAHFASLEDGLLHQFNVSARPEDPPPSQVNYAIDYRDPRSRWSPKVKYNHRGIKGRGGRNQTVAMAQPSLREGEGSHSTTASAMQETSSEGAAGGLPPNSDLTRQGQPDRSMPDLFGEMEETL